MSFRNTMTLTGYLKAQGHTCKPTVCFTVYNNTKILKAYIAFIQLIYCKLCQQLSAMIKFMEFQILYIFLNKCVFLFSVLGKV